MNSMPIISQTKLDMLQERVCRPINYLTSKVNSATPLWDGPIKMCQRIEDDVFSVDSVVKESRTLSGTFSDNATYLYQSVLCRVYILLYYRHRDDELYKDIVFPRLRESMGVYNTQHLNKINDQINKILAQEDLLKKVQEEKNKDVKPVFAYVAHTRDEMDHLYIEYGEEQLFRNMSGVIKGLSLKYGTNQDEANVWFNAKRVVHTLRDVNRPELLINRAATALVAGQIYNGYEGSQIILLCAYTMIRASKNNAHFGLFIKKMESLSDEENTDLTVIKQCIKAIKQRLDNEQSFDGYDYIGEQTTKGDTFTSADIERLQKQIQSKEEEKRLQLTNQIENLQKQLSDKDAKLQAAAKKDEQIAELTKKNGELEETCAQLQSQLDATAGDDTQKIWKIEKEDILVELLTPIFKMKSEVAKCFADEINGLGDIEIIDIVARYVKELKATETSVHRKLWSILHAFKIYKAGETNWNLTLNPRL